MISPPGKVDTGEVMAAWITEGVQGQPRQFNKISSQIISKKRVGDIV